MKSLAWYALIAVMFIGGLFAMTVTACSSTAARERNAVVAKDHLGELNDCLIAAKSADSGDRLELYNVCANAVDKRYGRKP